MLCSSCRRRETIDGFKTCPNCREAKRRCYQKKKEKIQDDINHYNDFTEKMNYYVDYVKYAVGKINELLNFIKNDEILKELKEH